MNQDKSIMQEMLIEGAIDFEYLSNLKSIVKEYYPVLSEKKLKEKTLEFIKILLEKKLLDIYTSKFNTKWNLSVEESIDKIDAIWKENASYTELISLIYFTRQKWFYQKLKSSGYDFMTDWKKFVEEKIGDLEKWIEENRPKDLNVK